MSSDPEYETRKHSTNSYISSEIEKDIQSFGSQGFTAKDTLFDLKDGYATTTADTNAGSSKESLSNQANVSNSNENLE